MELLNFVLAAVAIVMSGVSLWLHYRGQIHNRLVDFEEHRSEATSLIRANEDAIQSLDHEIRGWLRESDDSRVRELLENVPHSLQKTLDQLRRSVDEMLSEEPTAKTDARVALEQAQRELHRLLQECRRLEETVRNRRDSKLEEGSAATSKPP